MNIDEDLKKYIEEYIFPEYDKNEKAHGIEHIKYVIGRSLELVEENNLDVNPNIIYTVAAYHDIAHHIDRKNHEKLSAQIMYEDKNLERFFNPDELVIIRDAIEDHRASMEGEPRTVYGKIVSSADRNNTVEMCLRRTYSYGKKLDPEASDDVLFLRAYDVLNKKFGIGGYAKFYFRDKTYEEFLTELRELLADQDKFISTQREYIKKLKLENKI